MKKKTAKKVTKKVAKKKTTKKSSSNKNDSVDVFKSRLIAKINEEIAEREALQEEDNFESFGHEDINDAELETYRQVLYFIGEIKKKPKKNDFIDDYKERLSNKVGRALEALEEEMDNGCFRRGESEEVQIEMEMYEIFLNMIDNTN